MPNAEKVNYVEITVVGESCVYLDETRVAGSKPPPWCEGEALFFYADINDVMAAIGPTIEQSSKVAPLPKIATLKDSGGWRFLIDRQDPDNPDMLSGFKIDRDGSIGNGPSATTGEGGRLNLHRSHFEEATVNNSLTVRAKASEAITLLYTHGLLTDAMRNHARKNLANL